MAGFGVNWTLKSFLDALENLFRIAAVNVRRRIGAENTVRDGLEHAGDNRNGEVALACDPSAFSGHFFDHRAEGSPVMEQEDIQLGSEAGQVVIFRSRLRADIDLAELGAAHTRMVELVSAMPGFVSMRMFTAEDGESLTLVEFENEQTLLAWRDHPEHRAVQERGRAEFFAEYHMDICESRRAYRFSLADGRVEISE